jgi:Nucleoside-diphosphate-sugar epimerases
MILVTGASGLVGSHLVNYLIEKGHRVRALYHTNKPDISHNTFVELYKADIQNAFEVDRAMQGITHVYHCAALVSYDPRDREAMLSINADGTAHIVNACLEHRIKKLVYVSSIATLGEATLIDENTLIHAEDELSDYALSKIKAEREVWRGAAEGLTVAIVNPSIIIGEGNWEQSSAVLFKKAYEEFAYYTEGVTGWVDVKDVVRAMHLLMESEIHAERFVLNAENSSFKEVMTIMASAMNKRPPYKKASKLITEWIWRWEKIISFFTGKKPLITKSSARNAHAIRNYSAEKWLHTFSSFSFTSLHDTIHRCAAWYIAKKAAQ